MTTSPRLVCPHVIEREYHRNPGWPTSGAEAQAQTARELRLAAEVIVHSFKAMALATGTAAPSLLADTADPPLKAAVSLARHSHLA